MIKKITNFIDDPFNRKKKREVKNKWSALFKNKDFKFLILSYLQAKDLLKCQLVSRDWQSFITGIPNKELSGYTLFFKGWNEGKALQMHDFVIKAFHLKVEEKTFVETAETKLFTQYVLGVLEEGNGVTGLLELVNNSTDSSYEIRERIVEVLIVKNRMQELKEFVFETSSNHEYDERYLANKLTQMNKIDEAIECLNKMESPYLAIEDCLTQVIAVIQDKEYTAQDILNLARFVVLLEKHAGGNALNWIYYFLLSKKGKIDAYGLLMHYIVKFKNISE